MGRGLLTSQQPRTKKKEKQFKWIDSLPYWALLFTEFHVVRFVFMILYTLFFFLLSICTSLSFIFHLSGPRYLWLLLFSFFSLTRDITLSLCANRPFLPFDILSEPSPPRLCCRLYRFNSLICSYYPARGSGTPLPSPPPRPVVYYTYISIWTVSYIGC